MTGEELEKAHMELLVESYELRAKVAENEAKQNRLQAEFHRSCQQEESK